MVKKNIDKKDRLVIGLTGSFGSGCGTATSYFEKHGFKTFSLSRIIKEEAKKKGISHPHRRDMQNIGDELRQNKKKDFLAIEIIDEIKKTSNGLVVVKSIRNHYEIKKIRDEFPDFLLFNIDAEKKVRFKRCSEEYTSDRDFEDDDERDSGENQPKHGQHVRLCVDKADVVINNDGSIKELHNRIDRYLSLIKNPGSRKPLANEINMTNACQQSMQTGCLKRAVGAVITKNGHLIASGYNSTPLDETPCISLKYCYRAHAKECPKCKVPVQVVLRNCINCGTQIEKERLEELEKDLDLCRAIHAEERAILQIAKIGGQILKDTVLYTTTFPCLLCAKKIIEVGIREVVYIDPYPFREAYRILKQGGVVLTKFQGVKSRAFHRLYSRKT